MLKRTQRWRDLSNITVNGKPLRVEPHLHQPCCPQRTGSGEFSRLFLSVTRATVCYWLHRPGRVVWQPCSCAIDGSLCSRKGIDGRMDATLKELTSLVKEVYPEARKKGTHFNFAIVFTDLKRPGYRVKEIGSTMSGRKGTDDSMTLQSQKFQIGDYLDIAITPPNRAPPPSSRMRPY